MKGIFITIEGGDGSGKSTQIDLLMSYFDEHGFKVLLTREPGGTPISEKIRAVILDSNNMEMDNMTEVLLYAAARAQHVAEFIKPSIEQGKVVICDRFVDSSVVYQGYARGVGIDAVENINSYATLGLIPDLTILLDLPPDLGLFRKKNQQALDRLELESDAFHLKVNEGYRLLAKRHQNRILTVDATKSIEDIHQIILEAIKALLPK
ncbi:thymidylate kinase [Petrocella atlantisensis]|uniref:Thymidylate kinase n=1 Tax=Petrocella atlantisensis TaxID=2173034 RepID=A0A3P7P2J7_9FIRM|nr:dTMP kinase [Petrocella atlantisensis]VDN47720.1 thymidylate kinase [Petrocella atlantisensis]